MFKSQEEQLDVLGVGVDEPCRTGRFEGVGFHQAPSARHAINMLRMMSFDLILVKSEQPDMSTWDFLRHLKIAHPHQKFALVGGPLTEQQEVTARMFGAAALFNSTPTTQELLSVSARIREKAIATVHDGRAVNAAAGSRPSLNT